ncbi:ACP S-malonyltransferase [Actinomadura oligospora]|uniref:ACP S-malonyltransferase n=1 Tax=Actinomadura oligospora TaxID=111804 RepID=UPI0004B46BF5|nr:acyltransferase domain-containing protein [Actinomadura oligospora]
MTDAPPPWASRLEDPDEVRAFLFPGTGAAGAPDLRALAATGPAAARVVGDVLDAVAEALPPPGVPSPPSAPEPGSPAHKEGRTTNGDRTGDNPTDTDHRTNKDTPTGEETRTGEHARTAPDTPAGQDGPGGGWPSMRRILLDEPDTYRTAARTPGVPQLAAYTASVAVDRVLRASGVVPAFAVGQSFGEIAALVCAGAFSISDGARMAFTLVDVLTRRGAGGGMGLLEATEDDTRALIAEAARRAREAREAQEPGPAADAHRVLPGGRVGTRSAAWGEVVVACLNAPSATVVSGPDAELDAVLDTARDRGVKAVRLAVPYLSHHPAMAGADHEWYETIRQFPQRPLETAVHSPVRGRAYRDDDDLHRALADCIVLPVRLPDTLVEVAKAGATVFVEAGAGDALCRCARLTVPDVATVAPLRERPRPGGKPPVGKSAPEVRSESAPVPTRPPARSSGEARDA